MGLGVLGLVGGAEWNSGCTFDSYFLEASGSNEVTVLPTAAAYERPEVAVEFATRWLNSLGAKVTPAMVLTRSDAEDLNFANQIASSSFIYIGGGSPLHLRSVLKDSECFEAIKTAFRNGAVLVGSSAGAMVLGDPMVDPRGGALTLGLGLLKDLAIMPHYSATSPELRNRTLSLAEPNVLIAGIDEQTAIVRDSDGTWRTMGQGGIYLTLGGVKVGLDALQNSVVLDA